MKISGFTMGKNVTKLYYPVKESIMSILPICDEFIVVLGKGDTDDRTLQEIESIGSSKIKIFHSEWDTQKYPNGTEMAHQTDIAKSYCTGDWLFYIQADEVVHEKYLPIIENICKQLLNDNQVEGLLFKYIHFWGDYSHHNDAHGWYKNEIRIIRNKPEIHSWKDAQSFRKFSNFDQNSYNKKEGSSKLEVAKVDAYIFHYGWVRPPSVMNSKRQAFSNIYKGQNNQNSANEKEMKFEYGPLDRYSIFKDSHPKVMSEWINKFYWESEIQQTGKIKKINGLKKHEQFKYRFVTFLEKHIFFRPMWEFKNYKLIKR